MPSRKVIGVSTIEKDWQFEIPEAVRQELAKRLGRPLKDGDEVEFVFEDGDLVVKVRRDSPTA